MKIKIKKLHPKAIIPYHATGQAACWDLIATDMTVNSKFVEYGTGLALEIPEDHVGLVYARSSVSNLGMVLANSVGVIDSDYRGEVKLRFLPITENFDMYSIGERIGQLMILPRPFLEFDLVDELSEQDRGTDGFGTTGL